MRVAAAGVCHSDVHLADGLLGAGRWPMVLGHEGAGVVEAVGEGVTRSRPATTSRSASCRLAGLPGLPRGAADAVRAGRAQRRRRDVDGRHLAAARARRERAPARADGGLLRRVRGGAGRRAPCRCRRRSRCGRPRCWAAASSPGSAPSTAPRVRVGDSVCVIGCGGVGLQVIAGARLAGAARSSPSIGTRTSSSWRCARRHARGRRGRRRRRRGGPRRSPAAASSTPSRSSATLRRSARRGTCCAPAAPRSWSGWPRRASRCRCRRSSSSREKTITGSYYGSTDVHAGASAELVAAGRRRPARPRRCRPGPDRARRRRGGA